MPIKTVLQIAQFYSREFFVYPLESIVLFIRRAFVVGLLLLFWHLASQGGEITSIEIVPYIMIATGVQFFATGSQFPQAGILRRDIKDGRLNNLLVRPFDEVKYSYGIHIGRHLFDLLFSLLNITIGILLLSNISLGQIGLFALSIVPAMVIGYSLNVLVASSAFWIVEAGHFNTIMYFIYRIPSGMFIPLTLFGPFWGEVLQFLPFAHGAFVPSFVLTGNDPSRALLLVVLGYIQAPIMLKLARYSWKRGLLQYSGVGI